jgi:peptidoglycan/xylan/chitin deacetylase (PgdA/CDA1 family)
VIKFITAFFFSLYVAIFPHAKIPVSFSPTISSEFLSQDIIFHGATSSAKLALTFDADMTPSMKARMATNSAITWYNEKVVEVLRSTRTPATLFLTGMWIETHPEVSKQLATDPLFELGNHSYSHPYFAKPCFGLKPMAEDQRSNEITKTQTLLKNLTGHDNLYFRFPGGCYTAKDLTLVKSMGLVAIQWNSQGPDSFNTDTGKIINNLKRLTKSGAIIVLHLHGGKNAPNTADAITSYIPWAKSQGYEFVKLTDLLQ